MWTTKAQRFISSAFGKYLWVTNTVSCGGLLAVGDVIQQQIERVRGLHEGKQYDWRRTGRMLVVGLSQGPPHHIWYTWLDRAVPGTSLRTVGLKILADQFCAAPFFAITFFFGMGILEKKNMGRCWVEFKEKFPAVYLFDWCIWPPTQFINFYWIPGAYRVLYVNFVTVIWDVFLSYMKHYDQIQIKGNLQDERLRKRR